jgi:hypothetical protein
MTTSFGRTIIPVLDITPAIAAYASGSTVKEAAALAGISVQELNREIARRRKDDPDSIADRPKFSKPACLKGPRDPQVVIHRRKRREIKDWGVLRLDIADLLSDTTSPSEDPYLISFEVVELVKLHLGENIKES